MKRRRTATWVGLFAVGISLALMALSMSALVGSPPAKAVLLGSGILILSSSLILLQIRFFREGDARRADHAHRHVPGDEVSAPREFRDPVSAPRQLKNPRQRIIWAGMEGARALMNMKEEEARREDRRTEKVRLGLPDEEEILYIGDRSWLSSWPVALCSVILLAASTMFSGVPSLACLVAGLLGFLYCATANRLTRYYITNFRILVLRRSLLGGKPRWRVMHYPDIHRCMMKRMFARDSLRLEGAGGAMNIEGLSRGEFETACGVLREKTPCFEHPRW